MIVRDWGNSARDVEGVCPAPYCAERRVWRCASLRFWRLPRVKSWKRRPHCGHRPVRGVAEWLRLWESAAKHIGTADHRSSEEEAIVMGNKNHGVMCGLVVVWAPD